jgi:Lon protease-like protein
MSSELQFLFDPESFSGVVRLFPLPNLVVFPHVIQPLHIFEPRYRQLMRDALADDKLIAMALILPGCENAALPRPQIAPVACLSTIVKHERLADGRYHLLLGGAARVEIVSERDDDRLYRTAEAVLIPDQYPKSGTAARPALQHDLVAEFRRAVPQFFAGHEEFNKLLERDVALGMLTDILAFTLKLSIEVKQELLAEPNVDERARRLCEFLRTGAGPVFAARRSSRWKYPPQFSAN